MWLTAEFGDVQSVAAAIGALKARGFSAEMIDVFSTEPVELPEGLLDRPSRMSLVAVSSAALFCILATLFVRYTQAEYRIVTGGMPLFSWWPTSVIFYEFTMFGGISATFVMFLVESGLLKRSRAMPAPVLEAGRIQLRVGCDPEHVSAAIECFARAGAVRVEKAGDPS